MGLDDLAELIVTSRAELRQWFVAHADSSPSVWLVLPRRGATWSSLTYPEAVEEALCFGWIDATARTRDEESSMILLASRKPRSMWSATNKERLERLTAAGLMTPRGLAAVDIAKANGSWVALDAAESLEVPPDLAAALAAEAGAREYFDSMPPSARKGHLWIVVSAKRAATRDNRIAKVVAAMAEGRRII